MRSSQSVAYEVMVREKNMEKRRRNERDTRRDVSLEGKRGRKFLPLRCSCMHMREERRERERERERERRENSGTKRGENERIFFQPLPFTHMCMRDRMRESGRWETEFIQTFARERVVMER